MREDLQKRISAAIDRPDGVEGDPQLRALLDADPAAAAYAGDLARLGDALREWPLPELDDAMLEALATRIEQRLDETLPRIADPTLAPEFDDDDAFSDATAGLLGSVATSGEFELVEVVSSAGTQIPAAAQAPRVLPAAQAPRVLPASRIPPPPPHASPSEPAPKMAIPQLVTKASLTDDRISFPSIPPGPPVGGGRLGAPTMGSVSQLPLKKEPRRVGWMAGLAAAAALGLGVFATTTMYSGSLEAPAGAPISSEGASSAEPAPSAPTESPAVLEAAAVQPEAVQPAAAPLPADAPWPTAAGAASVSAGALGGGGSAGAVGGAPGAYAGRAGALGPTQPTTTTATARPARPDDARAAAPMRAARSRSGASGGGDVDALLAQSEGTGASSGARASGGGGGPVAAEPAAARAEPPPPSVRAEDLPDQPERGAVLSSIQSVEPTVRACATDTHGTATVRIAVAGSGRVTTATVTGPFAGTPVGSCVARAVRTARFPQFAGERFEITYPFQL